MLNGDLSNKISPRVVLVFEGAVGICADTVKFGKLMARKKYEKAIELWVPNELMLRRIVYLYFRRDLTFEVVTYLGEDFAAEVSRWLDERDIPVHRVWSSTAGNLARNIAYMPDLACVYDPEPQRWLTYGAKGRYLADVNQVGEGI